MAEKKRILWIDQLKGFAFFLVILGHSYGLAVESPFRTYLYSFHMPLFLMVSGINLNISKIYETSFFSYAYKLFKRMLVPYVWLNFFSLTVRYFISAFLTGESYSVLKFLRGTFIANTQLSGAPCPAAPTYYIILLFLAQLLFWLIVKITKKNLTKMGLCCGLLCIISLATECVPMIWHINVVPVALLWLYIGLLLMNFYKSHSETILSLKGLKAIAVFPGLFIAGVVCWFFNGRVSIHGNLYGKSFLLFVLGGIATSLLVTLIIMKLPDTKLLTFVGKNTLFFLGTHTVLLLIIKHLAGSFAEHPLFFAVQTVIAYFILIPVAFIATKLIPWANGTPLRKTSPATQMCKYFSVVAAGFVPCNAFINHFSNGILESTAAIKICSVFGYLLLCGVVCFLFDKCFKFMFIIEDKSCCRQFISFAQKTQAN